MLLTEIAQNNLVEIEQCLEEIKTANKEKDIEKLAKYTEQLDRLAYKIMLEAYFLNHRCKKQQAENRGKKINEQSQSISF